MAACAAYPIEHALTDHDGMLHRRIIWYHLARHGQCGLEHGNCGEVGGR